MLQHHWAALCVAIHVFLSLILINRAFYFPEFIRELLLAVPMSQCSLVAIWAVFGKAPDYLRFLALPMASMASWWVASKMMLWGEGGIGSLIWALSFGCQTLFVVLLLIPLNHYVRRSGDEEGESAKTFSFPLRFLILGTLVFAIVFAMFKAANAYWSWNVANLPGHYQLVPVAAGGLNAFIASACTLVFFSDRLRERIKSAVVVGLLTAIVAVFLISLIGQLLIPGPGISQFLFIASVTQAGLIYATLEIMGFRIQ